MSNQYIDIGKCSLYVNKDSQGNQPNNGGNFYINKKALESVPVITDNEGNEVYKCNVAAWIFDQPKDSKFGPQTGSFNVQYKPPKSNTDGVVAAPVDKGIADEIPF